MIRRTVEFKDDNYNWIVNNYQGKGLYYLINRLIEEFRELSEKEEKNLYQEAAAKVKKDLDLLRRG